MISDKVPLTKEQLNAFLWAGKADITVTNTETDNVEEYFINMMFNKSGFFVSVRRPGSIFGGKGWDYMGIVRNNSYVLTPTNKSKILESERSFQVFQWILSVLNSGYIFPSNIVITHNGKCGRCGRRLKDPESIKLGFGPHCTKMVKNMTKIIRSM